MATAAAYNAATAANVAAYLKSAAANGPNGPYMTAAALTASSFQAPMMAYGPNGKS